MCRAQGASDASDFGLGPRQPVRIEKQVVANVCFGKDGSVTSVTLMQGTGSQTEDADIVARMRLMKADKPPPEGTPPCVTLKITRPSSTPLVPPADGTVAPTAPESGQDGGDAKEKKQPPQPSPNISLQADRER
jgi:hypothetical protein